MTPMTAPIYSPQDDNTGWWTKVEGGRGDPDKSKTKTTPMAAPPSPNDGLHLITDYNTGGWWSFKQRVDRQRQNQ